MKADITTKTMLMVIAIFLGILVIGNPPTTNKAQAFAGGSEMIAGGEKLMWHLKDGKVRQCYGFVTGGKNPICSDWK